MNVSYAIARPTPRRPATLWRVARQRQTYRNILYLLAAFPLGLGYFVFLITGLSVGLGMLIIWVGLPILLLVILGWWGLAAFERQLAIWWLGVDIRPMSRPRPPGAGTTLRGQLKAHLSNQVTWTSLVYLLAKFPLGLFSFVLTVTLIALTARLIATPVPYLIDVAVGGLPTPTTVDSPGTLEAIWAILAFPLGIVVGLLSLHLLNGLALVSGRFAGLMLGMSDVSLKLSETTALAERERGKAERAEQGRRELIVNVSHELRTPVASIRGHVESLQMALEGGDADAPAPPPAELRAYLDIIHRETERLGALVNDLVPLARAEAGELRLDLAAVAAGEIVEEVYRTLAPLARRERSITLVRDVAPGLPAVWADRQRLEQVLLNLVRNAIAYTPTGGIVSIALERVDGPHLALTVADTGIGIAPEDLEHVFERFYRTDASRARQSGGFGLGLAIVRDLVGAMGGAITAQSTVGEGSRFRVLLLVAQGRG